MSYQQVNRITSKLPESPSMRMDIYNRINDQPMPNNTSMIKLNPIDSGNGKSRYNSNMRQRDLTSDIVLPQIKERRQSNIDGRGYSHA